MAGHFLNFWIQRFLHYDLLKEPDPVELIMKLLLLQYDEITGLASKLKNLRLLQSNILINIIKWLDFRPRFPQECGKRKC